MTIFRLKQVGSDSRSKGGGVIRWDYDRAELIADGVVHVLGIVGGLIAATALVVLAAVYASTKEIVSVSVYAAGLLRCTACRRPKSLAVSPAKGAARPTIRRSMC